jgi:hypothetical protein
MDADVEARAAATGSFDEVHVKGAADRQAFGKIVPPEHISPCVPWSGAADSSRFHCDLQFVEIRSLSSTTRQSVVREGKEAPPGPILLVRAP